MIELKQQTRTLPRSRVLSGMRPTGKLHLGNYMGALYNWVKLQQEYDCYFFIADLHALTTDYADPSRLKQNIFDIALDFFAAGINPGRATLFVQSHVPQHAELHLLFSMITPLGWLERVPTYKDQQAQLSEKDLNTYGFLGYPLLQSADILLYKPQYVPVGADQVAHVELTREVARRFNQFYSPKRVVAGGQGSGSAHSQTELDPAQLLLPEPEVLLTPSPKLPGLDGRKMSKSYGNAIYLTDPPATIHQKMAGMTNGGQRPTQYDPGDPDICPVGDLHKVFSRPEMDAQIREGCRTATLRCDQCKFMCGTSIVEHIAPMQVRRRELEDKPDTIWEVLEDGARRAAKTADLTMKEIRSATGLSRDLSGIRAQLPFEEAMDSAKTHDLSRVKEWWGLEPAVLTQNLRTAWRQDVAGNAVALKVESEGVWLTRNNRRVYVAAAQQQQGEAAWMFAVKPKSYEILSLLCWGDDYVLHDFIVPQKLYVAAWSAAKRNAGKNDLIFSVTREDGRYLLHLPHAEGIDITETESKYATIGD